MTRTRSYVPGVRTRINKELTGLLTCVGTQSVLQKVINSSQFDKTKSCIRIKRNRRSYCRSLENLSKTVDEDINNSR